MDARDPTPFLRRDAHHPGGDAVRFAIGRQGKRSYSMSGVSAINPFQI